MRQEARLRLSLAQQQRAGATAARYGLSGLELVAWLLSGELDGKPIEAGLAECELVARVVATAGHDPTLRRLADGTVYTLAVADVPEVVLVGPVPGKFGSSTLIVPPAR